MKSAKIFRGIGVFVLGMAIGAIIGVLGTLHKAEVLQVVGVVTQPTPALPKGWHIERNTKTGTFRWCDAAGFCSIFPTDTYAKAVESALSFHGYEDSRNPKYWQSVRIKEAKP